MKSILFVLLILVAWPVCAYEDGDWQHWNCLVFDGKLTERIGLGLTELVKFGDDMSEFSYHMSEISLRVKVNNNFSLVPGFRETFCTTSDGWTQEHMPSLAGVYKWKAGKFKLMDRLRVEFADAETAEDTWKLRKMLKLTFPQGRMGNKAVPYVTGEIFTTLDDIELNQTRLFLGTTCQVREDVALDFFYLWRRDKKGEWKDTNAFGIKFKFGF